MATAKSLQQHWQSSCHRKVMHVDELEDGEIAGSEHETSLMPAPTDAARAQDTAPEEDEQEFELKKRKPKKEKKCKTLAWLQEPVDGATAVPLLKQKQQGASYYNVYGPDARASVEIRATSSIRLNDVQALVLWTLADAINPRWAFVKNKPLVRQVVFVMAHGISSEVFQQKQHLLPNLEKLGKHAVVIAPNAHARAGQAVGALLNTTVGARKRKQAGSSTKEGTPPFPPSHYCLTTKEMESLQYPLPAMDSSSGAVSGPDGYRVTQPASASSPPPPPPSHPPPDSPAQSQPKAKRQKGSSGGSDSKAGIATAVAVTASSDGVVGTASTAGAVASHSIHTGANSVTTTTATTSISERMVALDCEMCITAEGFELTRISLVDAEGRVLMDELVVPHNPITDYNTRYSGITEEMLRSVETRLEDVQDRFLQLVSAETLLVGHSLENDLKALRIVHARCLDTAVLYPHPKGLPYRSALKVLALRFLKRKIQEGSHDSITDARTAMDLAQLKIRHGPSYGTSEHEGGNVRKLVDVLAEDSRMRCCLVDRRESLSRFATGAAAAIPVTSDEEAVQQVAKEAARQTYGFLWTQLLGLYTFQVNRAEHQLAQYMAKHRKPSDDSATEPAADPTSALNGTSASAADTAGESDAGQQGQGAALQEHLGSQQAQDFSDAALDRQLQQLDTHIGYILSALPVNTLLVVATGEGDTAQCRRMQELKFKRAGRVDGLPDWTLKEEEAYKEAMDREIQGLCWCCVKS